MKQIIPFFVVEIRYAEGVLQLDSLQDRLKFINIEGREGFKDCFLLLLKRIFSDIYSLSLLIATHV